jgi:hypothetical protein
MASSGAKKSRLLTAGNKGATQNGEDFFTVALTAQTFPLRCTRHHRHLNNTYSDRVSE